MYAFICVCMGIIMCICECRCPQRQEEGVESPGPRFIGGFELSNVGAGNLCSATKPALQTLFTF